MNADHLATLPLDDHLAAVPMEPGVLGWAMAARRVLAAYNPDAILVEYPAALQDQVLELAGRLPVITVLGWRVEPGDARMIIGDPCDARMEAMRLAVEAGLPVHCVDELSCDRERSTPVLPDATLAETLGAARFAEQLIDGLPPSIPNEADRRLATRLRETARLYKRPIFVGRLHRFGALRSLLANPAARLVSKADEATPTHGFFPATGRQLGIALREIPWIAWLWEDFRSGHSPDESFRVSEALESLLRSAGERYRAEYHEDVNLTEWRAIGQYARNLALVRGGVRPRLYEVTIAAKGCVDGDFGAITLQQALEYPPNRSQADVETELASDEAGQHGSLNLYGEFDGDRERLAPAYDSGELREISFEFKRRPRPTAIQKEKWRADFFRRMNGICSWPPEDEFIEKFFRTVRQRAYLQISENHSASEEFTSSTLDGLDVRETMRNWHRGKLYVRRERTPPGRIGPVILYWRDFPFTVEGLWRTTLYAENQNESDISIYSTQPGREMVGPGIARIDYFGILSVYPAMQIPDVWSANLYAARIFSLVPGEPTHARVLIAAGLLFSEERYVAVVGPNPPDSGLRQLARRLGKGLVYLPLGTFSKALLKRARQCHILSGHSVRGWAGDYIPRL
ncbi:hypothetical protein GC173_13970 [bacterium]|nr:hypothetical protein [bacterium]